MSKAMTKIERVLICIFFLVAEGMFYMAPQAWSFYDYTPLGNKSSAFSRMDSRFNVVRKTHHGSYMQSETFELARQGSKLRRQIRDMRRDASISRARLRSKKRSGFKRSGRGLNITRPNFNLQRTNLRRKSKNFNSSQLRNLIKGRRDSRRHGGGGKFSRR